VKFLDPGLLYETQQSSIIRTYLIDTMAVVGHDKSTPEAQENLQCTVNDSIIDASVERCDKPGRLEDTDMVQPNLSSALRNSVQADRRMRL
jgi:hypothetical protein